MRNYTMVNPNNDYTRIVPAVDEYRDPAVPDQAAFTWEAGILDTGDNGIFKVEFLSRLNPETRRRAPQKVTELLGLDHEARLDAETQPGFCYYFADEVSELGAARSFCLWSSAEDARAASERPAHQDAVGYAMGEGRDVYSFYGVTKTMITKTQVGLYFAKLSFVAVMDGEVVSSKS